jgi:hypothetical protein
MENITSIANCIPPKDFIKLNCVLAGVTNHYTIRKISFKDRLQYHAIIKNICLTFPTLNFKFGEMSTDIYLDKLIRDSSLDVAKFRNGNSTDNFLLKCNVYLTGPNVGTDVFFHSEQQLFRMSDVSNAGIVEQTFQNKFLGLIQTLNAKYGTAYLFSFKFSRIFVHNNEKTIASFIGHDGKLQFSVSEKSIESITSTSLVSNSNKKRRIEYESESDESDNE